MALQPCKVLHHIILKISLIFNIWTSLNYLAFLNIKVHFINNKGRLSNLFITFYVIFRPYTSINTTLTSIAVIKAYKFSNQIIYAIIDNISNNNTFIRHFYNHLGINQKHYQLYCGCNILNFTTKYSLYSIKKEKNILVNVVLKAHQYKKESKAALVLKV